MLLEGGRTGVMVDIDTVNGEATVETIRREGGDAIFVRTDVSKSSDVDAMFTPTSRIMGAWIFCITTPLFSCMAGIRVHMNSRKRSGIGLTLPIFAVSGCARSMPSLYC